jgi:glycosyltransferase involved in cell wall biosynthesis
MKIALLTSGRLPVPAVCGGAVETKLDYCLDYNEVHQLHDITVFSITPPKKVNKETLHNHYVFFPLNSFWNRVGAKLYSYVNKKTYYDSHIEYYLWRSLRYIRRHHFDCILIANRPGYIVKVAEATQSRIISQLNNDYINIDIPDAAKMKERCSLILTCSHYLNRRASAVVTPKHVPVITVHNGIEVGRFVNAHPIPRSKLGLKDQDFVVMYSGRLTKEKGVMELIKAIKTLHDIPRLRLVIIGASFYGKDVEKNPFVSALEHEAQTIRQQVVFTGYINYSEVSSYLKMADVAVVPSVWDEPFGLTVAEAMAAGRPLIATRGGGIPEICEGASILVERENLVQHLADSIRYLYQHPDEAKAMGKKAEEKSWEFDKGTFTENFFKAIHTIEE